MSSAKPAPHSRPGSFWSLFDRPGGWLFVAVFLAMTAGALWLQWLRVQGYREKPWIEAFALPKAQFVEPLALGYNAWFADFLFLRAAQAFGGIFYRPGPGGREYNAVFNYFDVISALDPHFIEAYSFGDLVMGDEGGRQDLALAYLEQGQWANWRRYVPWYEAAYVKIWAAKEPDPKARYYVRQAVKCHDAPSWIGRWEHFIDEQAGEFRIAILRWVQSYAEALRTGEAYVAAISLHKIRPVVDEWHQKILQAAADKFQAERGAPARDIEQLAEEGFLPPVEVVDPDLLLQTLDELRNAGQTIAPLVEQIVESSIVLKGGALPVYVRDIPDDRFVLVCMAGADRRLVWKESRRERAATIALNAYREQINNYYRKNGRYPESMEGWKIEVLNQVIPDPYGVGWDYDPRTGILRSKGNPDL